MSKPRPVFPNRTLLITRRCAGRQHLLTSDGENALIFSYFLAIAAKKFDVAVHAFVCMSNHYHLVVTDRHGNHPAFTQWLNAMVARVCNVNMGRSDSFWDGRQVNVVDLLDDDAVARKVAYVLANPVRAGLATNSRPSGSFLDAASGSVTQALNRPSCMRVAGARWPALVTLDLISPETTAMSHTQLFTLSNHYLGLLERAALRSAAQNDRDAQTSQRSASSTRFAPPCDRMWPRRCTHVVPRVATRDFQARTAYMEMLRAFERAHRDARLALANSSAAVFPPGTYGARPVAPIAESRLGAVRYARRRGNVSTATLRPPEGVRRSAKSRSSLRTSAF